MNLVSEWAAAYSWNEDQQKQFKLFQTRLSKQLGFSNVFTQLLWQRGLTDGSLVETFLGRDKQSVLEYYKRLYDTTATVELIMKASKGKHKVFIYGDYDVDGITSTSLLWRFLYREVNMDVTPFVPHRSREGYGLNEKALREMLGQQFSHDPKREVLLITVDCGVRDNELIARLKADYPKLTVIVTDHHQPLETLSNKRLQLVPAADAEIHPLHPKSAVEPPEICACAVAWALVCACRHELGLQPSLKGLELVALATVCDVMPLTGVNRQIVALGLEQMEVTEIPGLKALLQVARVKGRLQSYHLGFTIGPRLNAAGRIGEPLDAVRLLSTDSHVTALKLAGELDTLNGQRQAHTELALAQIDAQVKISPQTRLIIVSDPEWEEGIIGLIAGKVQEKYGLPAIAMTQKGAGEWVGSARSNKNVNITALLAQHKGKLLRYGGHVQAAGFSVEESMVEDFRKELTTSAEQQISASDVKRDIKYDLELPAVDINLQLIKEVDLLEPFGNLNFPPQFLLSNISISNHRYFGKIREHLAMDYSASNNGKLELVWFNHLFPAEQSRVLNQAHDFIGTLGYNEWNGNITPQFKVKHQRLWQG